MRNREDRFYTALDYFYSFSESKSEEILSNIQNIKEASYQARRTGDNSHCQQYATLMLSIAEANRLTGFTVLKEMTRIKDYSKTDIDKLADIEEVLINKLKTIETNE